MKKALYFLVLLLLLSACQKEGCMDINSASYDPAASVNDGICAYRYLKSVSVNKLPDIFEIAIIDADEASGRLPDLQFKMVKAYEDPVKDQYDWSTDIKFENVELPVTWEFRITDEYLLTEMEYAYKLIDVDRDGEDVILTGTFIPAEDYRDNEIRLYDRDSLVEVVLSYLVF